MGTDDGNLQISKDGGITWENIIENVPGIPKLTYVSRVIASFFEEGRAYVTFDGHRNDDFKAYVFVTNDYGESWMSISSNLPEGGTVNVIREHHRNPDLLFVGTERGSYISIDRGKRWVRMKNNLPVVPVDDIAIHPRDNDLIIGTHGRSVWVLDDITPLEQLTEDVLYSKSHLFDIREAMIFKPFRHKGNLGHKVFVGPNPSYGAIIGYYLGEKSRKSVRIIIKNSEGKKIRELEGSGEPEIHRLSWDLRYEPPPPTTGGEMGSHFRTRAPLVLPGTYNVTLQVSDQRKTKMVKMIGDPRIPISFEERKAQHDALYTLYKLYPYLHEAEKTSDTILKQIAEAEEIIKKAPGVTKILFEEITNIRRELRNIRLELVGNPKLGWPGVSSSVRGRLVLLGRAIEGYTGAPSPRQLQKIQKGSEELWSIVDRINRIVELRIPRLNELMSKDKIMFEISGEKIEISDSGN